MPDISKRRLPSYIYLPSEHCFDRWQYGLAQMRAGIRDAVFTIIGDSTDRGVTDGVTDGSTYPNSAFNQLPKHLARLGLNAASASIFGHGALTPVSQYENRLTGTYTSGIITVGGNHLSVNSGNPSLNFTPVEPWDTVTVFYVFNSGIGNFSLGIDGTVLNASVAGSGTPAAIKSVTATVGTVGTHTVNLAFVSGQAYITGIECSISNKKQVLIRNFGTPSSKSTDWTGNSNVYDRRPAIRALASDMTGIGLGINDWNQTTPTDLTVYRTNIANLIADARASGADPVLISPIPSAATAKDIDTQRSFVTTLKTIAQEQNCAFVDIFNAIAENDRNLGRDRSLYSGPLHMNSYGYNTKAGLLAPLFNV